MPEPTSDAWTQIRYDYEHTGRPVEDICAEHGISSGTLRDRVRRWRWTRRRAPIPREGPPAMAALSDFSLPPKPVEDGRERPFVGEGSGRGVAVGAETSRDTTTTPTPNPSPQGGGEHSVPAATLASGDGAAAQQLPSNADNDPASIAPRLQSAVARVLPAIETIIARLSAGPLAPREMEQTARALGVLTRTLRELNALLAQHAPRGACDDDDMPEDIDAFREDLARRINAFCASREAEEAAAEAADAGGEAPAER